MKKRLYIKGILGFVFGVFLSYTISIIVSICLNTGKFYPADTALVYKTGSVLKAIVIQYFGIGIIGSIMGISSIIFEKDEWSILFQTILHFIISSICIAIYLLLAHTNMVGISHVVLYIGILLVVYIVIWIYRIISCYTKIRKIKKKLLIKNDKISKVDKKNLFIIRGFVVLILGILVFITFNLCIEKLRMNSVKTSNLSKITVDGISIGEDVSLVDFENYTQTNENNSDYKYNFDELNLDVDNQNKVSYIFTRFDENKTNIKINDINKVKSIDDITQILGSNYYEKYYDKEQQLKKHIYYDRINNVTAEFTYIDFGDDNSDNNKKLCWIEIFKPYYK
ncbi:DUF3021 domain-containing protein [Romboutsia sp. Marseille-P6047]|uniref:DUF3021 domain-containing protein n=1 Tax=Romboutsia sp. Marseille-P6047 TaxID=2161817 RepID=UPI000F04D5E2|nr:DUF3021 domain-containing protein [Romboutsia sp. Marseille-P6047]